MIRYRSFRNTDPPALAEIWRSQPRSPRLAQPMSSGQLEQYVFSKTFFDPAGLIVAMEGARPIGFVHCGFGANATGTDLDFTRGAVCRLMAMPSHNRAFVLVELLAAGEDYLRRHGAQEAWVGNLDDYGPYYSGLYGSARLVGMMASDPDQLAFFQEAGYAEHHAQQVWQRSLTGFRAPVDRDQLKYRRALETRVQHDPPSQSWWEASTTSCHERVAFELVPKCGGPPLATAMAWHLQPLCGAWGVRAAGFETVWAMDQAWQDATANMLLADAIKHLQAEGVSLMEAVVADSQSPLATSLATLGFTEVDRGISLRKSLLV